MGRAVFSSSDVDRIYFVRMIDSIIGAQFEEGMDDGQGQELVLSTVRSAVMHAHRLPLLSFRAHPPK